VPSTTPAERFCPRPAPPLAPADPSLALPVSLRGGARAVWPALALASLRSDWQTEHCSHSSAPSPSFRKVHTVHTHPFKAAAAAAFGTPLRHAPCVPERAASISPRISAGNSTSSSTALSKAAGSVSGSHFASFVPLSPTVETLAEAFPPALPPK